MRTPQFILDQLLPRGDEQIGFQELLGVLLAAFTFGHLLRGSLWTAFIDNDGVMLALTAGGGGSDEVHYAIGRLWLYVAEINCDLHALRVESKANIADGPTRDDLSLVNALGARFIPPRLPDWLESLWEGPADAA